MESYYLSNSCSVRMLAFETIWDVVHAFKPYRGMDLSSQTSQVEKLVRKLRW